jgi:hypothetical protein
MRVRLIPTGQMELLALATSLQRVFPAHEFETVAKRVDPDGTRAPFEAFTSARLRQGLMPDPLRRLVAQLAAEVYPGRREGEPADLAVLIDDIELDNVDQMPLVAEAVRHAVRIHLADFEHHRGSVAAGRLTRALRERASFHLAVPMIEAWLFGDGGALRSAQVPEERLPARLAESSDPERFETVDAAFSADDGSQCAALFARNARTRAQARASWVLRERPDLPHWRREAHPKAYLSWLCRDPNDEKCSTYRESRGGAAGLAALDWPTVLSTPSHFLWARALVHDLAGALNEPVPPFAAGPVAAFPPTTNAPLLLRNL